MSRFLALFFALAALCPAMVGFYRSNLIVINRMVRIFVNWQLIRQVRGAIGKYICEGGNISPDATMMDTMTVKCPPDLSALAAKPPKTQQEAENAVAGMMKVREEDVRN
jgi:hypothetical protein